MDGFAAIVDEHLRVLVRMLGGVSATRARAAVPGLPDDDVVAVIESTSAAIRELEAVRVVATGVAAQRSARSAGQGGLVQKRGHRTAVSLIQDLTGTTRAQAGKAAQLGQALVAGVAPTPGPDRAPDAPEAPPSASPAWHSCLGDAFTAGRITLDQQSAIRRGLGEPATDDDTGSVADADAAAWASAADQLIDEAARRTVEDLGAAARSIRDHLDPDGAARRFHERFERRSFRLWTDRDGIRHGSLTFDDAGAALLTAIRDAALRPRRGGPRFVDPDEKSTAEALAADPRSNEQLEYDLLIDLLHSGALADAAAVFGTRQAGIRVVTTRPALDRALSGDAGIAILEDTNTTVPTAFAAQHACDTGTIDCTTDPNGNPLNLGREARLFSTRQRVALAIRDGGCGWNGCDRPPAYCEAHHIDKYSDGGTTDIDRGILLCRFHHMNLHHHGWHITRTETGPFVLHSPDPGVAAIPLHPRLERRYAFGGLQPPAARFRIAA